MDKETAKHTETYIRGHIRDARRDTGTYTDRHRARTQRDRHTHTHRQRDADMDRRRQTDRHIDTHTHIHPYRQQSVPTSEAVGVVIECNFDAADNSSPQHGAISMSRSHGTKQLVPAPCCLLSQSALVIAAPPISASLLHTHTLSYS